MPRPSQRALPRAASCLAEGDWLSVDGTTGTRVPRGVAVRLRVLRGSAGACNAARLGRRGTSARGLGECGRARGSGAGARLRCRGHRPLPHGAHVPRRPAARDRSRGDSGGARGNAAPQPTGRRACRSTPRRRAALERFEIALRELERLQQRDFEGALPRDGRLAGRDPADRPAAARIPAEARAADREGRARPKPTAEPPRKTRRCSPRSRRCTSRTPCSDCGVAGSGSWSRSS